MYRWGNQITALTKIAHYRHGMGIVWNTRLWRAHEITGEPPVPPSFCQPLYFTEALSPASSLRIRRGGRGNLGV